MTRVAIFVDQENLISYLNKPKLNILEDKFIPIRVWSKFNQEMLGLTSQRSGLTDLKHMGTWMFVSKRVDLHNERDSEELKLESRFLEHMKQVDSLFGFIIKYGIGYRTQSGLSSKGVDVNLVCQMLVGAFENEYDICILVSDDDEFIPSIEIVQNFYGKQVYHAGFEPDRLRAACFGNIPFEDASIFKRIF